MFFCTHLAEKHFVNSLIPFIRVLDSLSEDHFQFFDNTRFQRILVVAARAVDAVASSGTTAAPFFAIVLVEFVIAEPASHASIPVSRSILFKAYPLA